MFSKAFTSIAQKILSAYFLKQGNLKDKLHGQTKCIQRLFLP